MTVFLRYAAYALATGGLVGLLVLLEVEFPGSLGLQVFRGPSDALGTSEYSLVESLQLVLIVVSGLVFGAVAWCANATTSWISGSPTTSGRCCWPSWLRSAAPICCATGAAMPSAGRGCGRRRRPRCCSPARWCCSCSPT